MDDNNTNLNPIEESDPQRRTIMLIMVGVVGVGLCALFLIAFLWFRPDEVSLFAKYFPSLTPTVRPTSTPAPTRTPAPNLTATQLAWVKPAESPSLGSVDEAKTAWESYVSYIEYLASVYPDIPDVNQPGDIYIIEVYLNESEPLRWSYGWCATTKELLEENFSHMQFVFEVNEIPVPLKDLFIYEFSRDDGSLSLCREYGTLVKQWPHGIHHLDVQITFTQPTDDGQNIYPAGTHTFKYIVTVEN